MNPVMVYQVRCADVHGNIRIVHAYESPEAAQKAIEVMRSTTGRRYTFVQVENKPEEYWGVNFPKT